MSVSLLDVNVLVALFDPAHVHHDPAHRWFARNRERGWATCPLTQNGCIRVLSNPSYVSVTASPAEVTSRLQIFCSDSYHEFWPDAVSLLEDALFQRHSVKGHRMITDVYLLGLAVRHHAQLATFDSAIPLRSVVGAVPRHLDVLT